MATGCTTSRLHGRTRSIVLTVVKPALAFGKARDVGVAPSGLSVIDRADEIAGLGRLRLASRRRGPEPGVDPGARNAVIPHRRTARTGHRELPHCSSAGRGVLLPHSWSEVRDLRGRLQRMFGWRDARFVGARIRVRILVVLVPADSGLVLR